MEVVTAEQRGCPVAFHTSEGLQLDFENLCVRSLSSLLTALGDLDYDASRASRKSRLDSVSNIFSTALLPIFAGLETNREGN